MTSEIKAAILKRCEFDDGRYPVYKKRILPIITSLLQIIEKQEAALVDAVEHTSTHLEDMEHYFDNKCVPTVNEVNQCASADSRLRLAIGQTTEALKRLAVEK